MIEETTHIKFRQTGGPLAGKARSRKRQEENTFQIFRQKRDLWWGKQEVTKRRERNNNKSEGTQEKGKLKVRNKEKRKKQKIKSLN